MRRISIGTRDELLKAVASRYRSSTRAEKGLILTEFAEISGYHRKHAERLLRCQDVAVRSGPRPERRVYDIAVREALVVLWETSDRICGKRLKPLIPLLIPAMERHGHLAMDDEVKRRLLLISAATIDRVLAPVRAVSSGGGRRRNAHSSAVRKSVPIRTHADWNDPAPGFLEADLVAHSGPSSSGSYIQTLVMTDIATGWTECAPLLFREQHLLGEVMTQLRTLLPFPLRGFDTDNDSVFMNETIRAWCASSQVEFTRCRPYQKNDQAHVEQKNGAIVRRMVGYRRYAGVAIARELGRFYQTMRLFVNFFQPSFKLQEKHRDGAQVTKRYHPPLTPYQRILARPEIHQETKENLTAQFGALDPVALLAEIRLSQARLTKMADEGPKDQDADPKADVERFLDGLRHAWKDGDVRPTSQRKPPVLHKRTVPDPLKAVTTDLRCLFEQDPSRTGREFLEEIQAAYPDLYPVSLLRTVQRRVKIWRHDMAKSLVLGPSVSITREQSAADALRYVGTPRTSGTPTQASIG